MTDNDYMETEDSFSVFEKEETREHKYVYEIFSDLPKEVRDNLVDFVENYDLSVKYNLFSVAFNRYLQKQIVDMFLNGKSENENFYGLKTKYISNKSFWDKCKAYADKQIVNIDNAGYMDLVHVVRHVVQADGFSLSTYLYRNED